MYAQSPSDMGELAKLLADSNISKELRKNIETEIEKLVKDKSREF